MTGVYESRRAELYSRLPDGVRTTILTPGPTLRYLTGYVYPQAAHGNTSPFILVLSEGASPGIVLPALESDRARAVIGDGVEVRSYTGARSEAKAAFEDLWSEHRTDNPVAVEYGSMRLFEHAILEEGGVSDTVDVTDLIYDIRSRKDEHEITLLRRAATITDDVLRETINDIKPGVTESQIATALSKNVVDSDADELGVSLVVSGTRTAQIYTDTTDRAIEPGDLVLIDTGVVYEGYYTDVTRMVAVGDVAPEYRKIHETVQGALENVRDAAAPGITCGELDTIARKYISRAGYGGKFITTLGHGFGLEPHELPSLKAENQVPIEVGHTFTIEPGIYCDGLGGIRIEDNVVMTENGLEVLTGLPYTLDW